MTSQEWRNSVFDALIVTTVGVLPVSATQSKLRELVLYNRVIVEEMIARVQYQGRNLHSQLKLSCVVIKWVLSSKLAL